MMWDGMVSTFLPAVLSQQKLMILISLINPTDFIGYIWIYVLIYPLVNIQKTMENHHFLWENMGKLTIYKWTIWSIHPSQSKANASLLPFFQICWGTDALGARCVQLAAPWGWNPGHPTVMMGWQSPFIGYSSKIIHVSSTAHINPKSYKIYLEYSTAIVQLIASAKCLIQSLQQCWFRQCLPSNYQ